MECLGAGFGLRYVSIVSELTNYKYNSEASGFGHRVVPQRGAGVLLPPGSLGPNNLRVEIFCVEGFLLPPSVWLPVGGGMVFSFSFSLRLSSKPRPARIRAHFP